MKSCEFSELHSTRMELDCCGLISYGKNSAFVFSKVCQITFSIFRFTRCVSVLGDSEDDLARNEKFA